MYIFQFEKTLYHILDKVNQKKKVFYLLCKTKHNYEYARYI